jgi:glycosyltransferase involved in cell wall biosynthesis
VNVTPLGYALVTPVRNEAHNLPRLAECLLQQTVLPNAWVIVENGSTDNTGTVAAELAARADWITLLPAPEHEDARGGPVARAFQRGLEALPVAPDVAVKVDADLSFAPDYFERLLAEFVRDPSLGMASGTCYEERQGQWRQRHVTGTTVWGASRAYRWPCLREILPLEERMGWDGIDESRANVRGWKTRTLTDLPFRHYRREGERDGAPRKARAAQGRAARYMGYRPWYLVLRSLHHALREPAALAMMWGYASAALRREPLIADPRVREYVRRQRSIRNAPARVREALGRAER